MRTSAGRVAHLVNAGRHALPWLVLMLVSASGALAMQVGVESYSATDDALGSRPASTIAPDPADQDRSVVVLVSLVDASGNQEQLRCSTTADRISTDSLFLQLADVPAGLATLCDAVRTQRRRSPLTPHKELFMHTVRIVLLRAARRAAIMLRLAAVMLSPVGTLVRASEATRPSSTCMEYVAAHQSLLIVA
jgi:hypothetical protein